MCALCVTAFVAENYAICLSEDVLSSEGKAVGLSAGPHSQSGRHLQIDSTETSSLDLTKGPLRDLSKRHHQLEYLPAKSEERICGTEVEVETSALGVVSLFSRARGEPTLIPGRCRPGPYSRREERAKPDLQALLL